MNKQKFKQSGILILATIIFTLMSNAIWFVYLNTNDTNSIETIMQGVYTLLSVINIAFLGVGIIKQDKKVINTSYIVSIVLNIVMLGNAAYKLIGSHTTNDILDFSASVFSNAASIISSVAMMLFITSVFTWKEKQGTPKFKQSSMLIFIAIIVYIIYSTINAVKQNLGLTNSSEIGMLVLAIFTANISAVLTIIPKIILGVGILKQKKNVICASYIVSLVIDVFGTMSLAISTIVTAISNSFPANIKYSFGMNCVSTISSAFTGIAMIMFVKSVFSWIEPIIAFPPQQNEQ